MNNRGQQISDWLAARVHAAAARGLVVGISGGLDSAVVARLCQRATPDHVLGVVLPCHSDPQDEKDARTVIDAFGLASIRVDLDEPYDRLLDGVRAGLAAIPADQRPPGTSEEFDERSRVPLSNVKPRLRMMICAVLVTTIIARERPQPAAGALAIKREKGVSVTEAFELLRQSKHLQIIALVISFAAVGAAIIEQQLNMTGSRRCGSTSIRWEAMRRESS